MRRLTGPSTSCAKPFLALAMASALMFAMAASGDAREATQASSEPGQRRGSDGSIVVAGKLSSAFKGAAAASRAGRSRSSDQADDQKDHADDEASGRAQPVEGTDGNGPFKVIIPGQTPEEVTIQRTPPRAAVQPRQEAPASGQAMTPPEAAPGAKPASRVRTIFETPPEQAPREAAAAHSDNSPADVSETPEAKPAQPASLDVAAPAGPALPAGPTECMAGCYETTAARAPRPPSARTGTGKAQPAAAQPAPAPATVPLRPSLECVAGCDGIDTGKRPAMKRSAAPAPASDETTARITILRGVAKSKSYNVGQ